MPPRTEVRRYYSNRSRWPFEQVGILLAARKEFAEQGGAGHYALGSPIRFPISALVV